MGHIYILLLLLFCKLFISFEEANGDYDFGGTIGIYDHPSEKKETLYIPGPLKKPLALYVRTLFN